MYWKDLVSGALLSSLVERAKSFAIRRAIETGNHDLGLLLSDFTDAVDAEYKENEIFPKSDLVEDWLMLIDQAPENVADVKPIRGETRGAGTARDGSAIRLRPARRRCPPAPPRRPGSTGKGSVGVGTWRHCGRWHPRAGRFIWRSCGIQRLLMIGSGWRHPGVAQSVPGPHRTVGPPRPANHKEHS